MVESTPPGLFSGSFMKLFIRQSCKSSDSVLDEQHHPPDFCHETSPADFSVIQTSLS